jgi:signal transduction histidine kinase
MDLGRFPARARAGSGAGFAAYAAHELRGSITLQRTLAEVALADPGADTAALRQMGEQVVTACQHQQRLLDALLTLARNDAECLRHEPVNLAATVTDVLRGHDHHGLTCTTRLAPANTTGDPQLLERLIANLVANAIRHNIPHGRLDIATRTTTRQATLTIANTGPPVPGGELTRLFQPFQRLATRTHRPTDGDGLGLGLAIVQAIANAHDALLTAQAPTSGGLAIQVAFAAAH